MTDNRTQAEDMTLRVCRWDELYENHASRKISNISWIPVRNSFEGSAYCDLWIDYDEDAVKIFGAFILILQLASKCHPRGTLSRSSGRPHTIRSIAAITRAPEQIFQLAIPILVEHLGWLEYVEDGARAIAIGSDPDAVGCEPHSDRAEQNRTEQKRTEGNGSEVKGITRGVVASELSSFIEKLQDACPWAKRVPDHVYEKSLQIHRSVDFEQVLSHLAFHWAMGAPDNPPSAILAAFRRFDKAAAVRDTDNPITGGRLPSGYDDADRPYYEQPDGKLVYDDGTPCAQEFPS